MDYIQNYETWLEDDFFDSETKKELLSIKDDDDEIKDRFSKDIAFGTAGLRAILAAGTNRMNIYTVSKLAQAMANHLNKSNKKTACIAYDTRHMSKEFANAICEVLNANNIKTFLSDTTMPTPVLSFAIRELELDSGIMITASHNPANYNGLKVYNSLGGQVVYPEDEAIINEFSKIKQFKNIAHMPRSEAINKNLFNFINNKVLESYFEKVKAEIINKNMIKENSAKLNLVYTPLNGTAMPYLRRLFDDLAFKNIFIVKEQENPDKDFTTVPFPNPELEDVYPLAIKLAKEKKADAIIATDPDADRLGIMVLDKNNEYKILSGNIIGSLLCEYVLSQKSKKLELKENNYIIKSIVSSELCASIAKNYSLEYYDVLTGFKNVAAKVSELEKMDKKLIFSYEESNGFLIGDYARDKDGIVSSLLFAELLVYCKSINIHILDYLDNIYKKYSYFDDSILNYFFEGLDGKEKMNNIMNDIRKNPFKLIKDFKVKEFRDYQENKVFKFIENKSFEANLDKSNLLYFILEDDSWFAMRPSGTEAKIKIYTGTSDKIESLAKEKTKMIVNFIENYMKTYNAGC